MDPRLSSLDRPLAARALPRWLALAALLALAASRLDAQAPEPAAPPAPAPLPDASAPLPELGAFLADVRSRLHSDEFLLDQYTFTEKHVEKDLDSKGRVKKVKSETFEVYPSLEPGHTYRRLIEKDGKPLSAAELAEEDRKHEKKMEELSEPAAAAKRAAKAAEQRRGEDSAVRQCFEVYDIRMAGREMVDGRRAIVLEFHPKPNVSPSGRAGRILKTFAGRAWIDEADRQVVRVDAELIDTLAVGGILARLHKGSRASIVRRKVNDEIWLPAEARFAGSARILLVKGVRLEAMSEYSDYRKFQVATSEEVAPPENPPAPQRHD